MRKMSRRFFALCSISFVILLLVFLALLIQDLSGNFNLIYFFLLVFLAFLSILLLTYRLFVTDRLMPLKIDDLQNGIYWLETTSFTIENDAILHLKKGQRERFLVSMRKEEYAERNKCNLSGGCSVLVFRPKKIAFIFQTEYALDIPQKP